MSITHDIRSAPPQAAAPILPIPGQGGPAPTTGPARPLFDGSVDCSASLAEVDGTVIATVSRHTEPDQATGAPLTVVACTGDVDQDTVALLAAVLTGAVDRSPRVCCDLSRVDFFGAAGLNTVLAAHRYAAHTGHRFGIRGAHGTTRRVLEIAGVHEVLEQAL